MIIHADPNNIHKHCRLFYIASVVIACFSCATQTDKVVESTPTSLHTDYTELVNVFIGVEKSDGKDGLQVAENLPRIDTSWHNVRQVFGGTHSGAALPFGMVSVNAMGIELYQKGYPTGYNGKDFFGLSHFHHSGLGRFDGITITSCFRPRVGI